MGQGILALGMAVSFVNQCVTSLPAVLFEFVDKSFRMLIVGVRGCLHMVVRENNILFIKVL